MVFEKAYHTCMYATSGDEHYCRQVADELKRLARERMVVYRDERGVGHMVALPYDDELVVEIHAKHDRSLNVELSNVKYIALIRYVYNGQLKPVYATIVNTQRVYALNVYMPTEEILRNIFAHGGGHDN